MRVIFATFKMLLLYLAKWQAMTKWLYITSSVLQKLVHSKIVQIIWKDVQYA